MTKNKISIQAILTKNKGRMHPDACVAITQCNGIGIGGGGKLSAQGTISSSGTKSGQSVSICESGEAVTPYGGVAGSMCVNNSNETTFSGGLAVGGGAGIGADVCNTYTSCIFD